MFSRLHPEAVKKNQVNRACPDVPRLIPKDSAAYLTRVAPEDRTGVNPARPVAPADGTGVRKHFGFMYK